MPTEDYRKQGYLLEDFRLFHLQSQAGVKTEYHYHEFCKLILLRRGSGSYWVEGRRYSLEPGDMVLIGNGCIHKPELEPDTPYERIIIYISPDFLRRMSAGGCDLAELFGGQPGHVLRSGKNREFFRLADELERELSGDGFGRQPLGNALLLQLLVALLRELRRQDRPFPEPAAITDDRVLAMLRYIDGHLSEELTVEQLAEKFYWSKYHMMRRFRAETGSSIGHYITQKRLMLARELMAQGHSATDSCFRAGFGSYSSFTRTYGKFFGTTPTGRKLSAAADMDEKE